MWGPIHGCHVFAPILRYAGYGGIINVASAAAFGAAPGMGAYSVSKAGVLSLSETLPRTDRHGCECHRAVPAVRQDQHRGLQAFTDKSTQMADGLMRWTSFSAERVARTTWTPSIAADCITCRNPMPDRLGHQAFPPDGVHPAADLSTRNDDSRP